MALEAIGSVNTVLPGIRPLKVSDTGDNEVSFKDMLLDAINSVNQLQHESDAITEDFIAGRTASMT